MRVRPGRSADLAAVVGVLQEAKPHSIWSRVGGRVAEEYFRHYLASASELLVVATIDDVVVGACVGTGRPSSNARDFYLENAVPLLDAALRDVRAKPRRARLLLDRVLAVPARVGRRRGVRAQGQRLGEGPGSGDAACLMSLFVVSPAARGRRVGPAMLELFCTEMAARGFSWCVAQTSVDNVASRTAQERAGFAPFEQRGESLLLARRLSPSGTSGTLEDAAPLRVHVVRAVDEIAGLRDAWSALWRLTPEASAFQTPEWVEAHARGVANVRIYVVRCEEAPVAIFPMYRDGAGRLRLIGVGHSNYLGPVFAPASLSGAVRAWRDTITADAENTGLDLWGIRERSPFLAEILRTPFGAWGRPRVVTTNVCPEVDLTPGWDALLAGHGPKQRGNWRRKHKSLAALGPVEFVEETSVARIDAAFPRIVALYGQRWDGKRVSGAFAAENAPFQAELARSLAQSELVRLSLLRVDGEVIAFAYGLRGVDSTTSYVLAHDARFEVFSPGLLLLTRVLEAACARGEKTYDFSLGEMPYKAVWATNEQRVYSVLAGARAAPEAWKRRLWAQARDIPELRRAKLDGLRAAVGAARSATGAGRLDDEPGAQAGPEGHWEVRRVGVGVADTGVHLTRLPFVAMKERFSPRLLALALERHFRGDEALAVKADGHTIGVVWRAADRRAGVVTDGLAKADERVLYHPVPFGSTSARELAARLAASVPGWLVTAPLGDAAERPARAFAADLRFRAPALSEARGADVEASA